MKQILTNDGQILIEKYLPHNFLAEKMILSCLLINSEAIEITLKTLSIDAFYFQNHQEIYKAIIFMYNKKRILLWITSKSFNLVEIDDKLSLFSILKYISSERGPSRLL